MRDYPTSTRTRMWNYGQQRPGALTPRQLRRIMKKARRNKKLAASESVGWLT